MFTLESGQAARWRRGQKVGTLMDYLLLVIIIALVWLKIFKLLGGILIKKEHTCINIMRLIIESLNLKFLNSYV